jgi:NAD(P)-dependent dehydrogenase (short-subunit alcohol dehydrogenase family)
MTTPKIDLTGQVAVVTGAGRGIGRAEAMLLADRGAAVVVNDIWVEPDGRRRADDVVDEIDAAGGRAIASTHDITTKEGGEAVVASALDAFGRTDIFVHNAGLTNRTVAEQAGGQAPARRTFADTDLALLRKNVDVQIMGAYHVGRPAWRDMASRGYGRIILTGSASVFGQPGGHAYSTVKMAMVGLGRTLHADAQAQGIDIKTNVVAPMAYTGPSHEANRERFLDLMEPDNVAAAVGWLASPNCDVSGAWIRAGGTYVGRIHLLMTHGWATGMHPLTPEEVIDHLDAINDLQDASFPQSANDVTDQMFRVADEARRARDAG